MLQNLKKKTTDLRDSRTASKESGFTIIEVMIVLVIAAVIILIVFLAVPALQRNSRNNQRKNDAARISTATTEFINNNSGTPPTTWGQVKPYLGTMAIYTTLPADTATISNATASQTVTDANTFPAVGKSATCNADGTAATGGTSRQFVVLYKIEAGSSTPPQCIAG